VTHGANHESVGDEAPQHSVSLRSFALGKYDVTRGEYAAFVREAGYPAGDGCGHDGAKWNKQAGVNWQNPGFNQSDRDPVVCVTWQDARAYISWLNHKLHQQAAASGDGPYRLPTEAEWEYAARAGTTTARFWSDGRDHTCDFANGADFTAADVLKLNKGDAEQVFQCNDGHAYTAPVGSFRPNAFGLHDVLGNVFQWTEDCYHQNYDGAPVDGSARTSGECKFRVLRGGSWINHPWVVRSAIRFKSDPDSRYDSGGFRVARALGR
jgi:formylglycine-generating enzyme